eukprot:13902342-Alexandrium_andersonii.AAC.1
MRTGGAGGANTEAPLWWTLMLCSDMRQRSGLPRIEPLVPSYGCLSAGWLRGTRQGSCPA